VLLFALKVNQRYWIPFYKRNVVWAFFLLQQKNMLLDVVVIQMLRCIICHLESNTNQCDGFISSSHGSTTHSRKGIIQYNPSHGNISMKKHLVHEHVIELIKYKACMNEVEDGDGGG
jgi:hypothetical protein